MIDASYPQRDELHTAGEVDQLNRPNDYVAPTCAQYTLLDIFWLRPCVLLTFVHWYPSFTVASHQHPQGALVMVQCGGTCVHELSALYASPVHSRECISTTLTVQRWRLYLKDKVHRHNACNAMDVQQY